MIIIQKKKYMIKILNSTWIILSHLHHFYCDCHYDCRQHIDSPQRDLLFRWRICDGRGIHSSHTKTSKCTAHSYIYIFPKLSNFNIFFANDVVWCRVKLKFIRRRRILPCIGRNQCWRNCQETKQHTKSMSQSGFIYYMCLIVWLILCVLLCPISVSFSVKLQRITSPLDRFSI